MLPELPALLTFMAASAALIAAPGPAVLYVVARSLDQGRKAGIVSVLGIGLGEQLQVLACAFGLGALLAASATAFTVVKYLGAAYLIYLGIRRLRTDEPLALDEEAKPKALRKAFIDGAVVSFLNPKSALFFLAFLPQFIDPARGPIWLQVWALGTVFLFIGLTCDTMYVFAASFFRGWLRARPHVWRRQKYVTGAVYLGLGATAALAGQPARQP